VLSRHPQNGRDRGARIGPVPHQRLGPARLAQRSIGVKNPPNSNYISNSLWGVLGGPALGGLSSCPIGRGTVGLELLDMARDVAGAMASASEVPKIKRGREARLTGGF
jgi:hypothetical protein